MDASPGTCFHCARPLPARGTTRARIDEHERAFCCSGCEAAAVWIHEAGLGGYYLARAAPGLTPEPAAAVACADWDAGAFLAGHAVTHGDTREVTLVIEGIRCAACAWLIERALAGEPGVVGVSVNAATARMSLRWQPELTTLSRPLALLSRLGYRAHRPARDDARAIAGERRASLKRLALAGLGAMQAMMLSEALYLGADGLDPATRDFFRWVTLAVATAVVFYSGGPFLRGAWRELALRRVGMDLLVGVSVLLAWGVSVVETVRGGDAVYFDAAVMFVFFLLAARHFEQQARRRATAALDVLARAQPELALRIEPNGGESVVEPAALRVDDRVRVRVGDAVPADGVLLEATAEVDESFVTGESRPIARMPGETVLAGSLVLGRPLTLCVTHPASGSTVARLAELAARAQAARPRVARAADDVAAVFVIAMLGVALVTGVAWWWIDPARVLPIVLAVLAVTCPCALALAVPAALAAAQSRLAREGALVLDSDAIERLARVDTLVFDKTGTLTSGRPRLDRVDVMQGSRDEALADAAALERGTHHPLAFAFAEFDDGRHVDAATVVPGSGVEGRIAGHARRIGSRHFATGAAGDDAGIWLGDGRQAIARFSCEDALRQGARDVIAAFSSTGTAIELLSGDSAPRVESAAQSLGISRWSARCTPAAKLAQVAAWQSGGRCVAMVGDGINDAAVLAGADVAIAVASGAALAHASASIVLAGDDLRRLPTVFAVARRTRRVIRQNLAWAIGYNGLALPLAALGYLPPWLAALGMSASSLVVTFNALRLAGPVQGTGRAAAVAPDRLAEAIS